MPKLKTKSSAKRRFKITYLQQSFANIPRYVIESLFILSAVLFLVFLKINDKTNHEIIITLSLFGFAAIRLMPSFSRIFSSHQRFKFGLKAVGKFKKTEHEYGKRVIGDLKRNHFKKLQ